LNSTIILNSTSLYKQAADYIKEESYTHIILWQDNDRAGEILKNSFIQEFEDFRQRPIDIISEAQKYEGHKDLNDWLIHSGQRMSQFNTLNGNRSSVHVFRNYQAGHNFPASDLDRHFQK
jgi:hypothetical protein